MASGFLALLDDIVAVLDDVALMSRVAAQKTAGIVGDDLAVGAEQVVGVDPKRELPVIYQVAKGSLKNKAFLIPGALALSLFAPWAITPILMAGGVFLCFEGLEKILHKKDSDDGMHDKALIAAAHAGAAELKSFEQGKIEKAIRTDAILSGEIIAIALKSVEHAPFIMQTTVLTVIGVGMTFGIYGLVAGIVKLDDIGFHLLKKKNAGVRAFGQLLVNAAPPIMKTLSIVGTAAMFIVGGGILVHGIPPFHHAAQDFAAGIPGGFLIEMAASVVTGLVAGAVAIAGVKLLEKPAKKFLKKGQKVEGDGEITVPEMDPVSSAFATTTDLTGEMNAAAERQGPAQKAENKLQLKPNAPKPPRM